MHNRPKHQRVALFLPSLAGGGAERVFVTLANAMTCRGHRVDLVLVKAEGSYLDQVSAQVSVIDLDVSRGVFSLPAFVRYLRRSRPDTIISALRVPNMIAVLAAAVARIRVKTIITEHSMASQTLTKSRKGRILLSLMRRIYPHADAIVGVSQGVASDLEAKLNLENGRVKTIYNPIVSPELLRKGSEPVIWPYKTPTILAVGRFVPAKDYSTLLKAFARLREKRAATLIILGEGELRRQISDTAAQMDIAGDVIMPGFVSNPYAWMKRADLFVMSSAWEGLPTVLIEAMACGTPVVSTDCPSGPFEILEGGKWGRLVPVGDHEALAKAMLDTLDDPNQPDVKLRASNFNVASAVDSYHDLLGNDSVPEVLDGASHL